MTKSRQMIWIIAVVLLVVVGFWLKNTFFTSKTQTSEFVHGPFTIRMEQFTTSDFNMNYGKFFKRTNIAYSVLYNGKIVEFPSALQSNTGFSHLWRVYILKDAPEPTLVAGSQSVFMIKAKGSAYEVTPLEVQSSDFIKFQWLDAINGQPGPAFELFMGNETTSMEHSDTLAGGKYLMINQKLVIHIPTMEKFAFNKDSNIIPEYDKDGDALAFSPDEKIIVFPGHFLTWNSEKKPKYHNALMTYDFRKDVTVALPYSKNETRLYRPQALTASWFNFYFKWDITKDATTLVYQKPEISVSWQGYFQDSTYYLYPVNTEMLIIFKQFMLDHLHWDKSAVLDEKNQEYSGRVLRLGVGEPEFYLVGNEDEVHLMHDIYTEAKPSTLALILEIGNAFNTLLKTGKYQEYFTQIPENEEY